MKKKNMVKAINLLLLLEIHAFSMPNLFLIGVCILNKSNLIMHIIVLAWMSLSAGCINYHLVWYCQCKWHGSDIICTAIVQHKHVTKAWLINHGAMSNITMFLQIRSPQQLAFCSQFRKKRLLLPSQLLSEYSAVKLFSTVLPINGIALIVWQDCPGIINMVQLSWLFLHETVTVRCMKLPESQLMLFECTSWLFVIKINP